MKFIIGVTGASGIIYAEAFLRNLASRTDIETHLIVSQSAKEIMEIENIAFSTFRKLADEFYKNSNFSSPPASGSFKWDSMIVLPCSMKSISAIANGLELNLLLRAAQVTIKENRSLILAPRETPLNSIQLRNMLTLSEAGVTILPLCPAFYHDPERVEDLVDFMVGKILNLLNLNQELLSEWGNI